MTPFSSTNFCLQPLSLTLHRTCSLHHLAFISFIIIIIVLFITRMVQLPATTAIEYVAACCRTGTRTRTKTGTKMKTGKKTKIGTITKTVLGAYARSPQVQCVYAPSRLSVPSIVVWQTNKKTNIQKRETRPRSSAGSWPPLPKFSGYVEVEAHYIFHPSTIWDRPLFTELGPKNPHFAIKANEYMSP